MNHNIPAGIFGPHGEFFAHLCENGEETVSLLRDGARTPYQNLCVATIKMIDQEMETRPEKVKVLLEMGYTAKSDQRKKFVSCLYGALDGTPDVVDGKLMESEFVPCPHRGSCPGEGRLCGALTLPTGATLTSREVQVLSLVGALKWNKEIAYQLHIEESTVARHITNIQRKGQFSRKTDMVRFATELKLS